MTIEEFQRMMLECVYSDDEVLRNEATTANEYTELCKQGKLSREEYVELMEDIKHTISIHQNMADMVAKERLNTAINGLISIAKLV